MAISSTSWKPGTRIWEKRTSHGRKRIFESPELLWDACCEYFQWVEDNPLLEDRIISYQGVATHEPVEKMRAMTLDGLTFFLRIHQDTWRDWRNVPYFSEVIADVDAIIRNQKFTGAAADLLNANIIARDLGLSDKTETKADTTVKIIASPIDESL